MVSKSIKNLFYIDSVNIYNFSAFYLQKILPGENVWRYPHIVADESFESAWPLSGAGAYRVTGLVLYNLKTSENV